MDNRAWHCDLLEMRTDISLVDTTWLRRSLREKLVQSERVCVEGGIQRDVGVINMGLVQLAQRAQKGLCARVLNGSVDGNTAWSRAREDKDDFGGKFYFWGWIRKAVLLKRGRASQERPVRKYQQDVDIT